MWRGEEADGVGWTGGRRGTREGTSKLVLRTKSDEETRDGSHKTG